MTYQSTKTFGNDRGLSCCFRQHRADHSHCSLLHGYSIGVKVVIESPTLDARNWVFDFGAYKQFKEWLEFMFDHTVLIAEDDPHLTTFQELAEFKDPAKVKKIGWEREAKPHEIGAVIDLRVVPAVGCEAFAKLAFEHMEECLLAEKIHNVKSNDNAFVKSVEVFEHAGNSAIYYGENNVK